MYCFPGFPSILEQGLLCKLYIYGIVAYLCAIWYDSGWMHVWSKGFGCGTMLASTFFFFFPGFFLVTPLWPPATSSSCSLTSKITHAHAHTHIYEKKRDTAVIKRPFWNIYFLPSQRGELIHGQFVHPEFKHTNSVSTALKYKRKFWLQVMS